MIVLFVWRLASGITLLRGIKELSVQQDGVCLIDRFDGEFMEGLALHVLLSNKRTPRP